MVRFSQRNGYVQPRTIVQVDDLDENTRIQIWNVLYLLTLKRYNNYHDLPINDRFAASLWIEWHRPLEEIESLIARNFLEMVREIIITGTLAETFDVVEACVEAEGQKLTELLNEVFSKYLVGYRVVNLQIVPVTEPSEVEAIETAIAELQPFGGARIHLENAVSLLANREDPQYANVVKESISAVEAVARHLTDAQTLGQALKRLETKGVPIHKALEEGWSKLYGYTSADGGIRHGSIQESEVDEALATYFLITCSSMVGYLIKKSGN